MLVPTLGYEYSPNLGTAQGFFDTIFGMPIAVLEIVSTATARRHEPP